jgi:hypothetical protein
LIKTKPCFFKEFLSLAGLIFTIYTTINGGQNVEEGEEEKKYVGWCTFYVF